MITNVQLTFLAHPVGSVGKSVIMTAFTGVVVMWFNIEKEGEEEVRGIINYSGEKSRVCFSVYTGNGDIVRPHRIHGINAAYCY